VIVPQVVPAETLADDVGLALKTKPDAG